MVSFKIDHNLPNLVQCSRHFAEHIGRLKFNSYVNQNLSNNLLDFESNIKNYYWNI